MDNNGFGEYPGNGGGYGGSLEDLEKLSLNVMEDLCAPSDYSYDYTSAPLTDPETLFASEYAPAPVFSEPEPAPVIPEPAPEPEPTPEPEPQPEAKGSRFTSLATREAPVPAPVAEKQEEMKIPEKKKRKGLKVFNAILIVLLVLAFAGGGYYIYDLLVNNVTLCGKSVSVHSSNIDLRGGVFENFEGFERLENPESFDMRGLAFSDENAAMLRDMYPDSKVLYSVILGSRILDSDIEEIKIEAADFSSLDRLALFKNLKKIDAKGFDYDEVQTLIAAYPQLDVVWDIDFCGQRYSTDTVELSFSDISGEEVKKLAHFTHLEKVNATGCTAFAELYEMSQLLSDCDFTYTTSFAGLPVDNKTESLNFNRAKVADVGVLDEEFKALPYFPSLKKIDMCGCGVKSEQMAKWRDAYPDTKFIWEITFGASNHKWTVRTDIQVFSTLLDQNTKRVGDQNTYKDLFLYCTDLVALDLGHNRLTSLEPLKNLKKLQGLIITDNYIKHLDALASLPELVFLEANTNQFKDLTPLTKCPKLTHIDVFHSRINDAKVLANCKSLKYAILFDTHIYPKQEKGITKAINEKLPDCKVVWKLDTKGLKIRNNEVRDAFRLAFKNYKQVVSFEDYQHVTYKEGAKLVYPAGYKGKNMLS